MKTKISWRPLDRLEDLPEDALMHTPLGLFRASDKNSPMNQMNFVIMDTNFRVMKSMINNMNNIVGISAIVPLNSYCIVLSLAKLFKPENIKSLIELNLVGRIVNNLNENDLPENLKVQCKGRFGSLVFPNGEVVEVDEEDKEIYEKCSDLVGGILVNQN